MEAVLFFCSLALCVVTGLLYFKFENKDYKAASTQVDDLSARIDAITNNQNQYRERNEARLSRLEQPKIEEPKIINLNLSEPVKVQVVYRQGNPKLPSIPTPLLDKIGVTNRNKLSQ